MATIERMDEEHWNGERDEWGIGYNACLDTHVARLQAEVDYERQETAAYQHTAQKLLAERDTLKAELENVLEILRELPEKQVCDCGYDSENVDALLSRFEG